MESNNIVWKTVKLGEFANVVMGQSPNSLFYNKAKEGYPFLQGNRTFGYMYPTYDTWTTKLTKLGDKGDIIMSVRAPVGDLNIAPSDLCLGRGVCSISMKDGDNKFLFYLLKANLWKILSKENGTVFGSINRKDLINLEFDLPPLVTQRKIASILSTIDDKIELNNRMNENLEEQAQALYLKAISYSVDDELPEGWKVGKVGEVIELFDSKRIPLSGKDRDNMENKTYPYYGAASLMDYVDDYIFDGKYLLLGEDGTVVDANGYPILQYVWGKFWVNNHAHIMQGKNGFNVESLLMLFKNTPVQTIVTGAVQPKINQANLNSISIVIPPKNVLEELNKQIEPMFALVREIYEENNKLSKLRDTLLPKLMSGEIDVDAIEL